MPSIYHPSAAARNIHQSGKAHAGVRAAGALAPRGAHGGVAALGTHAKSAATLLDADTGELIPVRRADDGSVSAVPALFDSRSQRFSLQALSRRALMGEVTPRGRPYRVIDCCRARLAGDVAVVRTAHGVNFANVATCGSVWTCPVCSARVSEVRRSELQSALDQWSFAGGAALMVTLTHRHTRADALASQVASQADALRWMRSHRRYKLLAAGQGLRGFVRAVEVTHGANGWHPHTHEIWFARAGADDSANMDYIRRTLHELWSLACRRFGLGIPSLEHGVTVQPSYSAADYVAKFGRESAWGSARELTRSNTKRGARASSRTPWEILATSGASSVDRELYREFAAAFFGVRQLYWTRGLKDLFGIGEVSDEAIAAGEDEDDSEAVVLGRVPPAQWRIVCRLELRAQLLGMSELGNWPLFVEPWLRSLSTLGCSPNSPE